MKRMLLAAIASGIAMCSSAQTDSTKTGKVDTIQVGGMIIIREEGDSSDKKRVISISNRNKWRHKPQANVSTNWWIMDFGFANYSDNTNYASADAQAFVGTGVTKDKLELRSGKSVNVNIWFFMQKINITKHVLNFKYGLGMELNNYRFDDESVHITKNPNKILFDYKNLSKNKLAADYLTVPVMLNVNFTPKRKAGFGFSGGMSAGYLVSARQKIKQGNDKDKLHGNFGLEKWKLSYIGELSLGHVRLYGSYAMNSMWEKGLDQTPYNVGIRLSNW
jgi:hypothetical protein